MYFISNVFTAVAVKVASVPSYPPVAYQIFDKFRFLGNFPPTPPLS